MLTETQKNQEALLKKDAFVSRKKLESLGKKSEGAKTEMAELEVVEYKLEVTRAKGRAAERAFLAACVSLKE